MTAQSHAGDIYLSDSECNDQGISDIRFDQNYGILAETQESIDHLLCQSSQYYRTKKVEMVLVGRVKIDEAGNNQKGLRINILCIEQVRHKIVPICEWLRRRKCRCYNE